MSINTTVSNYKDDESVSIFGVRNIGSSVETDRARIIIDTIMLITICVIILFLIAHFFIRMHYKAKTEYAIKELRKKYEKYEKGPSPFAVSKSDEVKTKGPQIPAEHKMDVVLAPDQLAPILHHIALGDPPKIAEPHKMVHFKSLNC